MGAPNPFQIQSSLQIGIEQHRRERFKKTVLAIVVGIAMLLVGLLIEGCVSEHAATAATPAPSANATN
jgi:uncharacterized membrane protein SpoIIM required for sporulation